MNTLEIILLVIAGIVLSPIWIPIGIVVYLYYWLESKALAWARVKEAY
jgi:hypothetical protein